MSTMWSEERALRAWAAEDRRRWGAELRVLAAARGENALHELPY